MKKYKILQANKDFKFIQIQSNTKGSRKKRIILCKRFGKIRLGFFKYEKYDCSEACSEKLSYEIAKILKKPSAKIEFAKDEKGTVGIISFLFTTAQTRHIDARDLINKPEFDRKKFLTITNIENFLNAYGKKEFEKFIGIMVFDALIGETDRHEENWGLLKRENQYELSPIYDTGCNLLRQFKNKEYAKQYYEDAEAFERFIKKSKAIMYREESGKQYTHFELIEDLYKRYPECTKREIENLKRLTKKKIKKILKNYRRIEWKKNRKNISKSI